MFTRAILLFGGTVMCYMAFRFLVLKPQGIELRSLRRIMISLLGSCGIHQIIMGVAMNMELPVWVRVGFVVTVIIPTTASWKLLKHFSPEI